jgi:hypothetical protein
MGDRKARFPVAWAAALLAASVIASNAHDSVSMAVAAMAEIDLRSMTQKSHSTALLPRTFEVQHMQPPLGGMFHSVIDSNSHSGEQISKRQLVG